MYLFLVLTILFMRTFCTRNSINFYLCCMIVRRFGYLTRPLDCILVRVLHYNLIRWERHTTASQDHLTLTGELAWRQHSRPRLHRRLTLRCPGGTLDMRVATRVTMRAVVITPLMVIPGQVSEPEPPRPLRTLTGTLLWRGTSVMG
jgi:hypothetical protein